jgi:DNA-binding NarL/FixJ family response regulator
VARPKSRKSNRGNALLADTVIHVITTGGVETNLLTQFLEQETGAKCETVECIEHITDMQDERHSLPTLVLLDCFGKNKQTILRELNSCYHKMSLQHLLGLFNLSPDIGIERESVMQGVKGLFYENDELDHFRKGIHALCSGEIWVSRKIMAECIEENTEIARKKKSVGETAPLTRREKEILSLITIGNSNEEIADKLCLSHHTVKTHISSIFKKIKVPNRFQAALWAAENL